MSQPEPPNAQAEMAGSTPVALGSDTAVAANVATKPLSGDVGLVLSSPSIQAASLIRSIDSLSRIFWVSLVGTFLTIFFAGLSKLEANRATDYVLLGEYQIPKNILPLASLMFAGFLFWLTANRLRMLHYVLLNSRLPAHAIEEIFLLNPPVLHVFDSDNLPRKAIFSGVGVLALNWAVFFGNGVALTLNTQAQRLAALGEFDFVAAAVYLLLTVGVIVYGIRVVLPPLRSVLSNLHGERFYVGWYRWGLAVVVLVFTIFVNNVDQVRIPGEQKDDMIGPSIANAIDGETLFMDGVIIQLFGIDAVELEQQCRTADGTLYACGGAAAQALQEWVQQRQVLCRPLFATSDSSVVGICAVFEQDEAIPDTDDEFMRAFRVDNISRWLVESGHALGVGVGRDLFDEEQRQAQTLRVGIWQGSFEPPATWRQRHR